MSTTELEKEIAYIKNYVLQEEALILPKLKELSIDGINLEQNALNHKLNSEKIREESLKKQANEYRPNKERLYAEKEPHLTDFKNHISEERRKLEILESLNEPLNFYELCIADETFKEHTPLYVCANDYIKEQVILFEKETLLKHFTINLMPTYVNRLVDLRVSQKNKLNHMPTELSWINIRDTKNNGLVVNVEEIKLNQTTNSYINYKRHLSEINKSLNYIEVIQTKKKSFNLFKTSASKTKQDLLTNYYIKSIEAEKKKISAEYSKLLIIKDSLKAIEIENNTENRELEKEQIVDELKIIADFMLLKLKLNVEIKGTIL